MTPLSKLILAKIQESAERMSDYDLRSALGMAHTWVKGKQPEYSELEVCKNRDKLARELITILDEAHVTQEEMLDALREAREQVNAPFRVGEFERRARQKGEYKKPRQKETSNEQ